MSVSSSNTLQQALQLAVQSLQWTYSLFWQLCPQQGVLVWVDGYYDGIIKTRKTVQLMEVSLEEAANQRSQQLRELYDSLSTGEANPPPRRPCASLSPEDLTETEWFYLMCASFSFPPGIGIPGKAFARQRHVWLTRANEVNSKVFSRAILAKSANIQTIICIPLMDGVLELGTTDKVEEDLALIRHVKSFFINCDLNSPIPALSEHSTSNPADQPMFHSSLSPIMQPNSIELHGSNKEQDDDDDDNFDDNEDNDEDDINLGVDTERSNAEVSAQLILPCLNSAEKASLATGPIEIMQIDMLEGIRIGSPDDCSNNLDSELQMLAVHQTSSGHLDHQQHDKAYDAWDFLCEDLYMPQQSGATHIQELSQEDAHYSETLSAILRHNSKQCEDSSSVGYLVHSSESAFSNWQCGKDVHLPVLCKGNSQCLLKYILFTVPKLHIQYKDVNSPKSKDAAGGSTFRRSTAQEDPSANHVMAERRRREKLNEKFIILRSLVPFVTKMDKASTLGDTIEYVKQLRKRIHDLESRNRQIESDQSRKATENYKQSNTEDPFVDTSSCSPWFPASRNNFNLPDKRKLREVEGGNGRAKAAKAMDVPTANVQVSIIETDALLELQCPCRDGLLLEIMQTLDELCLEVTSIQSSSTNGTFVAELRAKVKEVHRKKTSITEVKKAIYLLTQQSP